jgi:two-component system, cell cycle response regulator
MTVRVLIIEDNPINRELIDYLLRAHGFETLKALDGSIGLDMARRERPDLILCDIQMPVMDGVEFAHHVKSDPALRATPLIALTALAMVGDRERILAEGFDGFITKPLDPATMVESLNAFLHVPPGGAAAAPVAASPSAAPADPARILVLDDSPFNLALERDLLVPHGHEVIAADSAEQAWALAQQQVPDLILSDVGMQTGSGFDFIRRVKADERLRDVPFIFLSSTHWDSASMEAGLRLGAVRYLLRPLDPARLLEEINDCLRRRPRR